MIAVARAAASRCNQAQVADTRSLRGGLQPLFELLTRWQLEENASSRTLQSVLMRVMRVMRVISFIKITRVSRISTVSRVNRVRS
jgi:hypothetical protein